MPSEATETVPVTEQEMQQPQVETGAYDLLSAIHVLVVFVLKSGVLELGAQLMLRNTPPMLGRRRFNGLG